MNSQKDEVTILIDKLFRTQYGKMVSYLTTKFGFDFLENAEDIVQETLTLAYQKWAFEGVPDNPEAWIFVVARNKSYNLIKKERMVHRMDISNQILRFTEQEDLVSLNHQIDDSMLRMILICCNLNLPVDSKILFILSCLCGFSRKELASALLLKEETVKKKLYRAKKQIRLQNMKLGTLDSNTISKNANIVANVFYILFNRGYNSSSTNRIIHKDICFEAMRLAKLMLAYGKSEPQFHALFSLMCFHSARFDSRIDEKGAIILFRDQDRQDWDRSLINAGIINLSKAAEGNMITAFHLEAAIAAEHCTAPNFEKTNWSLIFDLYKRLYALKPSPIILLNLSIVKAMQGLVEEAIIDLVELTMNSKLKDNYLLYATLGELRSQRGELILGIEAFKKAGRLTHSMIEKELLQRKIARLKDEIDINS